MITSWRITAAEFADEAFKGEGARLYGGRWNSPGVPMVYTSSSAALATLEILVRTHQREPLRRYVLFACSYDEKLVEHIDRAALPSNWDSHPAPAQLKLLGDRWVEGARSAVLEVPSVIIPSESNFLLNPAHPDFGRIEIAEPTPFKLDLRLVR